MRAAAAAWAAARRGAVAPLPTAAAAASEPSAAALRAASAAARGPSLHAATSPSSSDVRRTTARLAAARSVDDVFAVVAADPAFLSGVNVSTAWHRLAWLARGAGAAGAAAVRSDPRMALLEAATLSASASLGPQGVSATLWAAAALRHAPPPALASALWRSAKAALPKATPHALANLAWAAATLQAPAGVAAVVRAAAARPDALRGFAPQGLAAVLWACAAVDVPPGEPLSAVAARTLAADAASFKPRELATVATALAELRIHPGRRALDAVDSAFARALDVSDADDATSAPPHATAGLLWAFATLQHAPTRTLRALNVADIKAVGAASVSHASTQRQLPGYSAAALARQAWAGTVLGGGGGGAASAAWRAAGTLPASSFDSPSLILLMEAQLLARAERIAPPPLPAALQDAALAAWRHRLDHPPQPAQPMHAQVMAAVEALRLPHATAQRTADGLMRIDAAIEAAKGDAGPQQTLRIALMVDGPRAFAANTRTALGGTRCRDALLGARGWRVVSVPFFEWAPQRTDYERKLYLRAKLAAAGWSRFSDA